MVEVMFPAYRDHERSRVEVNNAMIALLAGSRLAASTLDQSDDSDRTLKELFPAVEHIERFNLVASAAQRLLLDADHHVASVAVPYALATHEAFVQDMIKLLRANGTDAVEEGERAKAFNMHELVFAACDEPEPTEWTQVFHVLREARNCVIHQNGRVSAELKTAVNQVGTDAKAHWLRINRERPPKEILGPDKRVALTAEHIFTAFAATKELGRRLNLALARHLPPAAWARIAVEDYAEQTKRRPNTSQWSRGAAGFAKLTYPGIECGKVELEAVARDAGLWTANGWT